MATKKKTSAAPLSPIERILTIEAESTAKDNKPVILYTCKSGEVIELEVSHVLTFNEMNDFVTTVVEAVVINDTYSPVIKQFIINNMIIRHYLKLNVDIDDALAVEFAYSTDLIDLIRDKIQVTQYCDMMDAIECGLEFKKQEMLSTERKLLNDSILRSEVMANKAIECIEGFNTIATQFKEIDATKMFDVFEKIVAKNEHELASAILSAKDKGFADNAVNFPSNSDSI